MSPEELDQHRGPREHVRFEVFTKLVECAERRQPIAGRDGIAGIFLAADRNREGCEGPDENRYDCGRSAHPTRAFIEAERPQGRCAQPGEHKARPVARKANLAHATDPQRRGQDRQCHEP